MRDGGGERGKAAKGAGTITCVKDLCVFTSSAGACSSTFIHWVRSLSCPLS